MSLLDKGAPITIRRHCGPKMATLLRYSLIYDQRDDRVFPTNGILLKTVNEYCGLFGNVHYTSSSVHGEFNLPILGGIVAQVCGRVGIIRKTSKTRSLPLESLYYCGGPLTLRGFKYGGAGPVVEGTPIGANVSVLHFLDEKMSFSLFTLSFVVVVVIRLIGHRRCIYGHHYPSNVSLRVLPIIFEHISSIILEILIISQQV